MQHILPPGFSVRRPTFEDLPEVVQLVRASELDLDGFARASEADMRSRWEMPGFDLALDGWLVIAPDGRLAANAQIGHREAERLYGGARVHPDYIDQGLYAYLLEHLLERARELITEARPDIRVTLNVFTTETYAEADEALAAAEFKQVRANWLMQIDMTEPPPTPVWSEGLGLRPYTSDLLYAVFQADDEAFRDHWGHTPLQFEQWQDWNNKREDFDPDLWFLAFDGDEIAGFALCGYEGDEAWVGELGVRRPWRRKGVGLALLHHAFGEFYRRGNRRVALHVDTQNLTGATRLYARAGMHPVERHHLYQLELRPGIDLSVQSLES
jgi:GNAT superfamily N-acetyltransferase